MNQVPATEDMLLLLDTGWASDTNKMFELLIFQVCKYIVYCANILFNPTILVFQYPP